MSGQNSIWPAIVSNISANGSGGSKEFQVGGKYRLVRRIGSGSFGDI